MAEIITIDDNNYRNFINPIVGGEMKRCQSWGMIPPWHNGFQATPFQDQVQIPLIPESEWDDIIDQQERDGTTIKQLNQDMGLHCLDQNGTSSCWAQGVVQAARGFRLRESGIVYDLSPASVSAPVKGFRDEGGWGEEALDYMIKHGCNEQADWPPNAISRRYYTEENKAKATRHIVLEYVRFDDFEQIGSAILSGWTIASGYSWWRHLTNSVGIKKRTHDVLIHNSWGRGWSDDGYGWLSGNKKYPDGVSVGILSMMAI